MMPVFAEAGSQRTDVYQIIRMNHYQVWDVMIFFVYTYVQQIQLKIFRQQLFQVQQVAVIAAFGVVDDDERIFVTVGCGKYFGIVPTADCGADIRNA